MGRGFCPDTDIKRHHGHLGSRCSFVWQDMPSRVPGLGLGEGRYLYSFCLSFGVHVGVFSDGDSLTRTDLTQPKL